MKSSQTSPLCQSRYRRVLHVLACPTCGAAPVEAIDPVRLRCGACGVVYPVENGVPILLTGASRDLLASGKALAGLSLMPGWFPNWLADWIRVHCLVGPGEDRRQRSRLAAFVREERDGGLVVDLDSGSRGLADHVLTVDIGPFSNVDLVGDGRLLCRRTQMKQKTKLFYIIWTLDIGGSEGQLVQLVSHLDRQRFDPIVCCLSSDGSHLGTLEAAGIPVKVIGFRGFRIFRHPHRVVAQLLRLVNFIRCTRPDIVHGFLFWAYIIGTFAAWVARVPIIVSSRRSLGYFKADKPHYLFLERIVNRMTDLIIANSEAVKQDVLRQERVEPSKIRVIYNGINPFVYDIPADFSLRASLGIPGEAKAVGVVANFIHYKGHRFLLQACADVKRKIPEVRFLLIGDGPLRGEMEVLAKELHLEKEVLFLGSRQDIPQLLTLMDVVVLPSLEEGFPNVVLEAMAAGKPIVATRVGGVPEAVVHRETGFLVPPGDSRALADAIVELLSDPDRAVKMGEAGRKRVVREFPLDRMVHQMEQVYEDITQARLVEQ